MSENKTVIEIISGKCPQNHKCPAAQRCPVGALVQKDFNSPVLDKAKCTGCGLCARICGTGAIKASTL